METAEKRVYRSMGDLRDVLHNVFECKRQHEAWWPDHDLRPEVIDNVAVLFSSDTEEARFWNFLRSLGWKQFNESTDHVVGHLHPEDYDVRFTFFRDPDDADFRIETMLLDPRDSHVHDRLLRLHGEGAIAQGSYKPQGVNSRRAYQEENHFLAHSGFELIEVFQSTYGPYTYFQQWGRDTDLGYLKVRLNERDAQ